MANVSQRAQGLGTENAFIVLAEVNKLIREGRDVISFCIGQPDFHTPMNIQDAGVKAIREGRHGYTPSAGIAELRQAVADVFMRTRGIKVDADDVVHDGHHQVFGHVLDLEHINPGLNPHARAHGDEHFHRRVAGAGTQAGGGRVDAIGADLGGLLYGHRVSMESGPTCRGCAESALRPKIVDILY